MFLVMMQPDRALGKYLAGIKFEASIKLKNKHRHPVSYLFAYFSQSRISGQAFYWKSKLVPGTSIAFLLQWIRQSIFHRSGSSNGKDVEPIVAFLMILSLSIPKKQNLSFIDQRTHMMILFSKNELAVFLIGEENFNSCPSEFSTENVVLT